MTDFFSSLLGLISLALMVAFGALGAGLLLGAALAFLLPPTPTFKAS